MRWEADELVLWSRNVATRLNAGAMIVWFLCDGCRSVGEIKRQLSEAYADTRDIVEQDVDAILGNLIEAGALKTIPEAASAPSKPLRVGFCGFWPGFSPRDNYFLWMLTVRFQVLLVDPPSGELDFLFDGDAIDPGSAPGVRAKHRVQVCLRSAPDFESYDYVFSEGKVKPDLAHRHFGLPAWSLLIDWRQCSDPASPFRGRDFSSLYPPEIACAYLYGALFEKKKPLEPTESSTSKPQAPSHTPKAEIRRPQAREHPSCASGPRLLTIGMATYDDFDGVYFTVQAIRLFHPEVTADIEILILDNHPGGPASQALHNLVGWVDGCRYLPFDRWQGTAVRDLIFREARTPWVMCVDSHVFLYPGALKRFVAYIKEHPDSGDLLQGVLQMDDLKARATHFKPVWSAGMWGVWAEDARGDAPDNEAFEIPMQGLGLFACRKAAWPGFNPRFRGFGGEEGYIHEKFRQRGGRTLCLPFLRWLHRFGHVKGIAYPNLWADRVLNYQVGFRELGLDTQPIDAHFEKHLGKDTFAGIQRQVQAELDNPFHFFDAIYCINLDAEQGRWSQMQKRFQKLGIARRVLRVPAVETPDLHHAGCALSHRRILAESRRHGHQRIMVFEDDALFHRDILACLKRNLAELERQDWQLFYLGGHRWGRRHSKAEGCQDLETVCGFLTCTHAVAYHRSVFDTVLESMPETVPLVMEWLKEHKAIDQFLMRLDKRFLASPVLATQPCLVKQEEEEQRACFTI